MAKQSVNAAEDSEDIGYMRKIARNGTPDELRNLLITLEGKEGDFLSRRLREITEGISEVTDGTQKERQQIFKDFEFQLDNPGLDIGYTRDIGREGNAQDLKYLLETLWRYEDQPLSLFKCMGKISEGVNESTNDATAEKATILKKFIADNIPEEADIFAAIEKTIEKGIAKIEQLSDPGEKLMKYDALKKSYEGAYDASRGHAKNKSGIDQSTGEIAFEKGKETASAISSTLMIAMAIISVFGLAASSFIMMMAFPAAPVVGLGVVLLTGRKFGAKKRNALPAEERHASNVFELNRKVDKAIKQLSSPQAENVKALLQSPYLKEEERLQKVTDAFPPLAAAFDEATALRTRQTDFLLGRVAQRQIAAAPAAAAPRNS